ncbi:MAG: glycosyl hydrolase 53 family protein [Pseudomonadota bacterium]|nr:MAG: glycoside hydrolase family 53 [Pseudomonadota bacterium]
MKARAGSFHWVVFAVFAYACSSEGPAPGSGPSGGTPGTSTGGEAGLGPGGSPSTSGGAGGAAPKAGAPGSGGAPSPPGGGAGPITGGTGGASGGASGGGANGGLGASSGTGGSAGGAPSAMGGGAGMAGGNPGMTGDGGKVGDGGAPQIGGTAGSAAAGASGSPATGGSGGAFDVPFILGADVSSVQESKMTFRDTDGQTKSIFELLKNHGFNYIRLKTFVDPMAPYGYASSANGCKGLPEAFGDRDHVVAFGKQAKEAGMGFLLDFHYSDVWADPGNQIIPEAWRGASSITELAALMKAYTKDVIETAIAAGARPDMVQVGNEITPGMLMHVPGPNTDCWGNNPARAPFGGSTSNWNDLATLLTAGIEGVREVDPDIRIVLHIENTDDLAGVKWWVDNALSRGVDFDVLGLSCYTEFQGPPSVWRNTFTALAESYPELKFVIAEYNPERTEANRIMKNLPGGRGLGTFFWEPTRSGEWGPALFTFQGGTAIANANDFAEFDALRSELGL